MKMRRPMRETIANPLARLTGVSVPLSSIVDGAIRGVCSEGDSVLLNPAAMARAVEER